MAAQLLRTHQLPELLPLPSAVLPAAVAAVGVLQIPHCLLPLMTQPLSVCPSTGATNCQAHTSTHPHGTRVTTGSQSNCMCCQLVC